MKTFKFIIEDPEVPSPDDPEWEKKIDKCFSALRGWYKEMAEKFEQHRNDKANINPDG
jgi:hypothetical protein